MRYDLDADLAAIDAQEHEESALALLRTRVTIHDRDLELVGDVEGEYDADWETMCNEVGEASVALDGDDDLAQWAIDAQHLEQDMYLVFRAPWKKAAFKVFDIEYDEDEHGNAIVRLMARHILDEMKHLQCWPNTFAPLAVQAPKVDFQWGNSIKVIKGYAHRNLLREQHPGWIPGFDIWDASNWRANFDNAKWPMVMVPYIESRDGVGPWCALGSRMDDFWELVHPTLEDGGLQLTADLWEPGDPQPCPSHFILDRPTMVFDVKKRATIPGITGTILDPIRDLLRIFGSDGTSDTVTIADPNDDPDNADPNGPWVIFRRGQHRGLKSKMVIHKPIEHTIMTGGKSPDAINQGAKLLSNILLGLLGTLIGMPWLTLGIFDKAVEDVILAWASLTNYQRKANMGRFAHKSGFEAGGGIAVSPSGLQTIRVGLHKARGYVSFASEVDDANPYRVGLHIDDGLRAGFEIGDRIWLSHIASVRQSWSRDNPDQPWEINVGDYRSDELAGTRALRGLEAISGALRQHSSAI
ncbi:hypothetical protein [Rhodococcus sp. LW-XY12]|uniref:Gp37-like protein n=1 Tax=Rhodococcus sp. LW-XY12 TaxID=2856851 RepID=UPI001C55B9C6|nr:hypothetical protein [Rhodococcus sp. LW-XY12]QXU53608.1 hypothetical protein KXC42_23265 [Rhodococcus sp. LW-XY12]